MLVTSTTFLLMIIPCHSILLKSRKEEVSYLATSVTLVHQERVCLPSGHFLTQTTAPHPNPLLPLPPLLRRTVEAPLGCLAKGPPRQCRQVAHTFHIVCWVFKRTLALLTPITRRPNTRFILLPKKVTFTFAKSVLCTGNMSLLKYLTAKNKRSSNSKMVAVILPANPKSRSAPWLSAAVVRVSVVRQKTFFSLQNSYSHSSRTFFLGFLIQTCIFVNILICIHCCNMRVYISWCMSLVLGVAAFA